MKLTLVLFLLSTFSVLSASAEPLRLAFWHSMGGERGQLLKSIIKGYNELPENQGKIFIAEQYVGSYEEGINKLRTAHLGGHGPHIIQVTDIGTGVMIDSHTITPLQDFIDKDPSFPLDLLLPQIRGYYEYNGKLYSLPFATSDPVLYYNKNLFAQAGLTHPPETFSELEDYAKKLTNHSTKIFGITWPLNSWFYEQFLAVQGANLTLPDNGRKGARAVEANYLSAESVAFVSMWQRMTAQGSIANVGRSWAVPEQSFLAGRTAMLITSSSDVFDVQKEAKFPFMTAPLPVREASDKQKGGVIIGGNSLWILNDKPMLEQKAAYEFLKYLASAAVQERWHTHTGYFPIRRDVIESLKARGFYEKNPASFTAIKELMETNFNPATQGSILGVFPEVRDQVARAMEEMIAGDATVDETLKKAKARTDFSLLRYNRGK